MRLLQALCAFSLVTTAFAPGIVRAQEFGCKMRLDRDAYHDVSTSLGTARVYEAIRNQVEPKGERCYIVMPFVTFNTADGTTPDVHCTNYGDVASVVMGITCSYPAIDEVVHGLRDIDPGVTRSHIAFLRFENFYLDDPMFEIRVAGPATGQTGLALSQNSLTLKFTTRPGYASRAEKYVSALRAGAETASLTGLLPGASERMRLLTLTSNEIASSKSYADFDQATKDKAVLASQVYDASVSIVRERRGTVWDEFQDGDATDFIAAVDGVATNLIRSGTEHDLDPAELRAQLSPYHVNLSSDAFQPSVINEFAADVKNSSDEEWKTNHKEDVRNALKTQDLSDVSGSAHVSVFKIFGGGGSAAHKTQHMSDSQLNRLLEDNNYFHGNYDKSFKYQMKGKVIEHISVRALENLSLSTSTSVNEMWQAHRVLFGEWWVPLQLDPKVVRRAAVNLSNPPLSLDH